jgi:hypothetical protein
MARGGRRRGANRVIQEVSMRPGLVDTRLIPGFDAAFGAGKSAVRSDRPMKSKFIDAFDLFHAYAGVREKHTRVTFDLLRRMAKTCEPMAAIIHLRCNQAAAFAKTPRSQSDTGFKLTTRDPEEKIKDAHKKEIRRITDFLLTTGLDPNPQRTDNFDRFLRKITRDSLVLDAYAFEIVPGKNPKKFPVSEVWAVDAATIRLAEEDFYRTQVYPEDQGDVAFIQEIDGRIVAEYTREELAYGIRNPTTELDANGYGVSELEEGINLITSILLASQFNRAYFSNNSTPRGYLSVKGNYSEEHLDAFKRAWRQQLEGAANAWRTPIMAFDDDGELKWNPLDDKSHRDMEYHLWLDWLTNVLCSLYGVNPAELGFKGYQPSGPSLSDGSQEKQVEQGEDKGLLPLMTNIGNTLNHEIIWRLNDEFVIEWSGLQSDERDAQQKWFLGWQAAGVMTTNEVRTQALDLEEIKEEWADAPANATLMQAYTAAKQAEQMAAQPGAATAGGPMLPPNNQLHPGFVDKPGEGDAGQPHPGQPGQPGQPPHPGGPVPPGHPSGPPAPGQPNPAPGQPNAAPAPVQPTLPTAATKPAKPAEDDEEKDGPPAGKPFGKSVEAEPGEIVIELDPYE